MGQNSLIDKIEDLVALLPNYHNVLEGNEAQTRWMLIDKLILDIWCYSREDVIVEYSVDKEGRVSRYDSLDYCIIKDNKPKILIEAKSLGVDLYSKVGQLSYYFERVYSTSTYIKEELIGVLTDGDLYLFFTDSKEEGVLDKEPFLTVRLSCSEDFEKLKLLEYSKNNIKQVIQRVEHFEGYELSEYYRIDEVEKVYNYYESKGVSLSISSVYINRKFKTIKSFRTLYRETLRIVNNMYPDWLYSLAEREEKSRVEGSISDSVFCLKKRTTDVIEIKTKQGIVYATLSRTRKGLIDRIAWLSNHTIGLFNLSVRLKKK